MSRQSETLRIDTAHEQFSRREYAPSVEQNVRLELSRRIDWRFLLPDPRLGTVACIGSVDEQFRDALLLSCQSIVFFQSVEENAAPQARFDIVVLCNRDISQLDGAAALVRPGGYLYAEVSRSFSSPATWRLLPNRVESEFIRLGFSNCAAHWHYPGFIDCTTLVPIDDGASARYFFDQQGAGLRKLCKSAVGRLLLAIGLLPFVIGSFSIVGERPAS